VKLKLTLLVSPMQLAALPHQQQQDHQGRWQLVSPTKLVEVKVNHLNLSLLPTSSAILYFLGMIAKMTILPRLLAK
jgi:hypothetical protein